MRVWQVQGGSVGGTSVGWKLLRMDEAAELKISEDASEAPREGYKKGDPAMTRIFCEV